MVAIEQMFTTQPLVYVLLYVLVLVYYSQIKQLSEHVCVSQMTISFHWQQLKQKPLENQSSSISSYSDDGRISAS